jgi:hypothetical protein
MSNTDNENKKETDAPVVEHKKKTFKEYYADPAFKERHNAYIKESVLCPTCDCYIKRYNSGHHKKSLKHKRNDEKKIEESQKLSKEDVLNLIEKLQKLL